MTGRCDTCKFWNGLRRQRGDNATHNGLCLRYPPVFDPVNRRNDQPFTTSDERCGEHEAVKK